MSFKKAIAVSAAALSLISLGISVKVSAGSIGDSNRSWQYGKSGSTAYSNLLDNVATHSSDVYDTVTGAYNTSMDIPVRQYSYAQLQNTGSHVMIYGCSVAYWADVMQ